MNWTQEQLKAIIEELPVKEHLELQRMSTEILKRKR